MTTIWDVAHLANVSKTTVSRVITNSGPVKEETRRRVEAAMKELNYYPNYMAQGIRTGKTQTIAMFVPDHTNTFYNSMLTGVEEVALQNNYMVMICNTNKSSELEIKYAQVMLGRNIDGIIYNTYIKNEENIRFFEKLSQQIPVVFMDDIFGRRKNISFIFSDGRTNTMKAVEYVYRLGCRRIAYLRMPPDIGVSLSRFDGYCDGLKKVGLDYDDSLVYNCEEDELKMSHIQIGENGAGYFMSLSEPPDAILSANDTMAIGAVIYLKRHGVGVPEEVKVVGYDNIDMCTVVQPNLTTIAQPTKEMGKAAATMIINDVSGIPNPKRQMIYDCELIVREST